MSVVARMSQVNRGRRGGAMRMLVPVHLGRPSPPSRSRSSVPPLPVPGAWGEGEHAGGDGAENGWAGARGTGVPWR